MKRLMLILCFVVILSGSAFAGAPPGLELPTDGPIELVSSGPTIVIKDTSHTYYNCIFVPSSNYVSGGTVPAGSSLSYYFSGDPNSTISTGKLTLRDSSLKPVQMHRWLKVGGVWVEGTSDFSSLSRSYFEGAYSDSDIHYIDSDSYTDSNGTVGGVFFSPPSPVKELPRIVVPQIVVIAGAGILLILLMLLPILLRRLWGFL